MTIPATAALEIVHNAAAQRFEVRIEGWLCRCDYRPVDGELHLLHTEVPPLLEGRGIAARLVEAALDHAEQAGLRVRPRCSYVHSYLRRHPERAHLQAD